MNLYFENFGLLIEAIKVLKENSKFTGFHSKIFWNIRLVR